MSQLILIKILSQASKRHPFIQGKFSMVEWASPSTTYQLSWGAYQRPRRAPVLAANSALPPSLLKISWRRNSTREGPKTLQNREMTVKPQERKSKMDSWLQIRPRKSLQSTSPSTLAEGPSSQRKLLSKWTYNVGRVPVLPRGCSRSLKLRNQRAKRGQAEVVKSRCSRSPSWFNRRKFKMDFQIKPLKLKIHRWSQFQEVCFQSDRSRNSWEWLRESYQKYPVSPR